MSLMRVGLVQANLAWNDPTENVARSYELGDEAHEHGAELIVFPEVFTSGFSLERGSFAQRAGDAARSFLADFAATRGVWVAGSAPDAPDGDYSKPYNCLMVYGPEGLVGEYRKIHLFSYGAEHERYRSGQETLTLQLGEFRVSWLVCYDLRFPAIAADLANTTDVYVVVANWPTPRRNHWRILLQARAVENQAYFIGVNRVGIGGGLQYSGDSLVVSPRAEILVDMGDQQGVAVADLQKSEVDDYRREFPCLRDRRLVAQVSQQYCVK